MKLKLLGKSNNFFNYKTSGKILIKLIHEK